MHQFVLISFCNIPSLTTSPVLCMRIPKKRDEPISYAPITLGFPELTTTATGLANGQGKVFVLFNSQAKYFVAVLRESDLSPLFYQALPEVKDGHSILIVKDRIYVVSTGTDEIISYLILDNTLSEPCVFWKASNAKSDTQHVNFIIELEGYIYISASGLKTGKFRASAQNGYVHNNTRDIRIKDGINHPHSLSVKKGRLYYNNSHKNTVCSLDDGKEHFHLNGYTRGLGRLSDEQICLSSSIGQKISKSTGFIANPHDPGEPAGECSFVVGSILTKEVIAQVDLSWLDPEIYDILVLQTSQVNMLELSILSQKAERQVI